MRFITPELRNEAIKIIEYLNESPRNKTMQQKLARNLAIIALKHYGFIETNSISDDKEMAIKFKKLDTRLFGNIVAEKDGQKYIISIKTRGKYQRNGNPNPYILNLINAKQEKVLMASPDLVQQNIGAIPSWVLVIYDNTPEGLFFSIYFGGVEKTRKRNLFLDDISLKQYIPLIENQESKQVLEYYRCDVLVIVPLPEEFNIFKEYFEVRPFERCGITDYYIVKDADINLHVYCLILGQTGLTYAGIVTTKAIMTYSPRIVILIGIAGAIDTELLVGDVVIGSQITAYLVNTKITDEGIFGSGRPWPIKQKYFNYILNFPTRHTDIYNKWNVEVLRRIQNIVFTPRQKNKIRDIPKMDLGYIASGDIVGSSIKFAKWLRNRDRKYLALEMEAGGVVESCHTEREEVDSLVIRGISDFAYQKKSEFDRLFEGKNRHLAMISATYLLLEILHTDEFKEIIQTY